MTVKELIEELNKCPENMPVHIHISYDDGFCWACGEVLHIEKDDVVYLINDEG